MTEPAAEIRAAVEAYEAEQRQVESEAEMAAYRTAARTFTHRLNSALLFIATKPNPVIAAWQVAYALGLPLCGGMSMADRARELGVKRATLSKGAKAYQESTGLPLSPYMRDSSEACHDARDSQLTNPE